MWQWLSEAVHRSVYTRSSPLSGDCGCQRTRTVTGRQTVQRPSRNSSASRAKHWLNATSRGRLGGWKLWRLKAGQLIGAESLGEWESRITERGNLGHRPSIAGLEGCCTTPNLQRITGIGRLIRLLNLSSDATNAIIQMIENEVDQTRDGRDVLNMTRTSTTIECLMALLDSCLVLFD